MHPKQGSAGDCCIQCDCKHQPGTQPLPQALQPSSIGARVSFRSAPRGPRTQGHPPKPTSLKQRPDSPPRRTKDQDIRDDCEASCALHNQERMRRKAKPTDAAIAAEWEQIPLSLRTAKATPRPQPLPLGSCLNTLQRRGTWPYRTLIENTGSHGARVDKVPRPAGVRIRDSKSSDESSGCTHCPGDRSSSAAATEVPHPMQVTEIAESPARPSCPQQRTALGPRNLRMALFGNSL